MANYKHSCSTACSRAYNILLTRVPATKACASSLQGPEATTHRVHNVRTPMKPKILNFSTFKMERTACSADTSEWSGYIACTTYTFHTKFACAACFQLSGFVRGAIGYRHVGEARNGYVVTAPRCARRGLQFQRTTGAPCRAV